MFVTIFVSFTREFVLPCTHSSKVPKVIGSNVSAPTTPLPSSGRVLPCDLAARMDECTQDLDKCHVDSDRAPTPRHVNADYIMYSTFLTVSSGSVLFTRSNLLKRKDLCFSCLRLGLIRHRRSLRSSHLFL